MKLRIKFTFLTFGLIATLVILSSGLYFVSNRIIKLKDYNIRLSEAKYDVAKCSDGVCGSDDHQHEDGSDDE